MWIICCKPHFYVFNTSSATNYCHRPNLEPFFYNITLLKFMSLLFFTLCRVIIVRGCWQYSRLVRTIETNIHPFKLPSLSATNYRYEQTFCSEIEEKRSVIHIGPAWTLRTDLASLYIFKTVQNSYCQPHFYVFNT